MSHMRRIGHVGLVGCGAIGTVIAKAIDKGAAGGFKLEGVYDIVREKAEALAGLLSQRPQVASSAEELIRLPGLDLIVEAASQQAVRELAVKILAARRDLMIMSVGALVDPDLLRTLESTAVKANRRIYVPSGAIAGLDAVKAASAASVSDVTLTSRKSPKALKGSAYLDSIASSLGQLAEPKVIYEGRATEACRLFPANVNVAATLSIASLGPDKVKVRVIADPTVQKNVHEISVRGEFGELFARTANVPSPHNPATSYLAALSAIAMLRRLSSPLVVGT